MRDLTTILAGALGGALLAVVIIFAAAQNGMLPMHMTPGQAIHDYLLAASRHGGPSWATSCRRSRRPIRTRPPPRRHEEDRAQCLLRSQNRLCHRPRRRQKSVVEFYDYNCPYCRASLPAVVKFYEAHKDDTRFSFIEFPIK